MSPPLYERQRLVTSVVCRLQWENGTGELCACRYVTHLPFGSANGRQETAFGRRRSGLVLMVMLATSPILRVAGAPHTGRQVPRSRQRQPLPADRGTGKCPLPFLRLPRGDFAHPPPR